ncbi:MAG: hypothetical protein ING64_01380 [Rhodocyclaceae bacterium]|nr:hypothetical protein [Rhodocyclaceae bacterium]MCA3020959.1 hypothetical protein [Rhodocyclaceae bacterium]MCA3053107.1 hypothetical protein [Rhodocyclaceae bacterium]MCA3055007.1 hypothetical protein [Rhodocyclaceae bacterium]
MTNILSKLKASYRQVVAIAIVLVALVAFGILLAMDKRISFNEEVGLADGRVVIIERLIKAKPLGEVGGPGGWDPLYNSFEFVGVPEPAKPSKWESDRGLMPMLVDRDPATGEWFVVATFFTCEPWYALGRPKLPYTEFRYRNGGWLQSDLSSNLIGRKANVSTGIKYSGEAALLTRAEKVVRETDARIVKKYLEIVPVWKTSC